MTTIELCRQVKARLPLNIAVTVKHKNGSISNYSILRNNILQPTEHTLWSPRRLSCGRLNIASGEDACFQ